MSSYSFLQSFVLLFLYSLRKPNKVLILTNFFSIIYSIERFVIRCRFIDNVLLVFVRKFYTETVLQCGFNQTRKFIETLILTKTTDLSNLPTDVRLYPCGPKQGVRQCNKYIHKKGENIIPTSD